MAKVKFITIPAGLENYFNSALQAGDRFVYSTVRKTNPFVSRKKKAGLTQKSLLPLCASIWNAYNETVKGAWNTAGLETGLTGFKFFVQDKVLRLQYGLEGESTPSLFYQSKVGNITINPPAVSFKITQIHPKSYFVLRKKTGKATMYQQVQVIEDFMLPLDLEINYLASFSSVGAGSYAKYYAIVYSLYQGRTIETQIAINFVSGGGWKNATAGIGEVIGQVLGYALFIETYNVRGFILVDNISAIHSGQNWVRDTHCNNIRQAFTKQFYQVPSHWAVIDLPSGSFFDSEYGNL